MSQELNNNGSRGYTIAPAALSGEKANTALTAATTTFIEEVEQTTAIILATEEAADATTPAAILRDNPILKQLLEQPCKFRQPGAMDNTGE